MHIGGGWGVINRRMGPQVFLLNLYLWRGGGQYVGKKDLREKGKFEIERNDAGRKTKVKMTRSMMMRSWQEMHDGRSALSNNFFS